jgi:hypothetical protein
VDVLDMPFRPTQTILPGSGMRRKEFDRRRGVVDCAIRGELFDPVQRLGLDGGAQGGRRRTGVDDAVAAVGDTQRAMPPAR